MDLQCIYTYGLYHNIHDSRYFYFLYSELGLIVFEIDPKGCAARDGRVQVRDNN